uniref:Large ribosomal subunit protein eL33 n=1 Tax=Macrostomum lignano TaxID=282301 RepID=A0A1I8JQ12_9PLAT
MSNPAAESGSQQKLQLRSPGRMYVKAVFTGYKRGLRNQHENTACCVLKALRNARRWTSTWANAVRLCYVYKGKRTDFGARQNQGSRDSSHLGRVTGRRQTPELSGQVQHQPARRRRWASASESCCTRLVSKSMVSGMCWD